MTTPNQQVFQAILQRPSEWRRLGGSTIAVAVAYAGLLLALVAFSGRTEKQTVKIPQKLVVTLFDAPRVAKVQNLGIAGGAAAGAVGGAEGTGPVLKAADQRVPRPTPSVKSKVVADAKALPNDKPKDNTGAGAEKRPVEPSPAPVHDTNVASSSPEIGALTAGAGTKQGTGPVGPVGGLGGSGTGSASGTGGTGAGSGAGNKAGVMSGDTQVMPFMDGMTRPTLISKVDPQLTREARNADVKGLILTKCVITTTGALTKCRIVKGIPLMDQAVLAALSQWKYSPVMYQGKPAAVEYLIPVRLAAE